MKKWLPVFLIFLLISCSDAEIVSGTFHGKIYTADTTDATVIVSDINDGYIRLEVNGTYIEHAQLTKNNTDAYTLSLKDQSGNLLTGYYYEGFLHFDSWSNQYWFEGIKE